MLAERLKKGDCIAVFSPSSPATATAKKRYERGKDYLIRQGFRLKEGRLTGKQDGYRSGSVKERAKELNELIHDPEVKCIMAAIGGMNSNALLPYLDYGSLKKHPKIVIGYSDVTALLLGIYAKTGLVTYYGPAVVASFGEFPPFVDKTWEYFTHICMREAEEPWTYPTPKVWTEEFLDWETQDRGKIPVQNQLLTLQEGVAEGRLIGGNLNTMEGIWGSEYMPEIRRGDLLFLEDSLKDAATVERSFALLKANGIFDRVGGIILGKHEKFDDLGTGRAPWEILLEIMGKPPCPVLAQFDCCHTHPMLTMPLGCRARLDAGKQEVTVTEPFIR